MDPKGMLGSIINNHKICYSRRAGLAGGAVCLGLRFGHVLVLVAAHATRTHAGQLLLDAGRGGLDVDVGQVGARAGGEVGQDRRVQVEVGDGTLDAGEVDAGVADARPKGLGDGGGIRLGLDDVDEHRRAQDDGG